MSTPPLRQLPSVDRVLSLMDGQGETSRDLLVAAVRETLERARAAVKAGQPPPPPEELATEALNAAAEASRPSLRRVINATGVILQTNLGRAPLSERALAAMAATSRGYSNLEYDIAGGARGSRHVHVRKLIREVTGAEDGMLVNNNAAALFMVLSVFAAGREVIVSRGQAVEIGGGFRIPDVLRSSGAHLVEVGTTNRTYARDYEAAITPATAAILRVHTSNFRVVGFVHEATTAEMAEVARGAGVLLLDDLGSGCVVPTERFGLAHEPTVQESLAAGASLALFSGDKLLGGPQCGVIAGRADLVEQLRRHPLARALRVDRLTIAAFEATMASYARGTWEREIPVWRMAATPPETLKRRARAWATAAGGGVVASRSMVGGGSLPGEGLPTWCAALEGGAALSSRLRAGDPPIVARIEQDRVLLDPRTVDPADDREVRAALRRLRDVSDVT